MRLTTFAASILTIVLTFGLTLGGTGFPAASAAAQAVGNAQNPSNQPAQQGQQQDQQKQPPQSQQPLRVQVNLVNVFATVRDKHKGIISNLKKEDFKIREDGVEQQVAYFSKDVDLPITLGLLIDTSGSMDRVLPAEQDAASRFLREVMRPKDLTMVINFDLDANLIADFTQDVSVLERAIRSTVMNAPPAGIGGTAGTIPNSGGGPRLFHAVFLSFPHEISPKKGGKTG